jgi:hypothetical protein
MEKPKMLCIVLNDHKFKTNAVNELFKNMDDDVVYTEEEFKNILEQLSEPDQGDIEALLSNIWFSAMKCHLTAKHISKVVKNLKSVA